MTTSETGFPGAEPPERVYSIEPSGVRLAVHEWGDELAPVLMLAHGGFDFARTFETFAPLLAAGGWRVVAWDQRGHGDSARTHLYSWEADVRDASGVFEHVAGRSQVAVIGHSKGGSMMLQLADAEPFRFSRLVNIDGMPTRRPSPDIPEFERTKMLIGEVTGWLDHRHRTSDANRKPGTIDELARRRARMNPRLSHEWLCHLVTTGGFESDDGWRWKVDPSMRFGGFGPWRPEAGLMRLPGLGVPFYGILVEESEEMGWGTVPSEVEPFLPDEGRVELVAGVGHFAHIEQPELIAGKILDFLGEPR